MSDSDTTILYTTDNSLDPEIEAVCRSWLLKTAMDTPIISVSQKPVGIGMNVCVGEIGRSWLSLHKQVLAGLEAVETRFVTIAEHDCIYSREHLDWTPPRDDVFYYNNNMWLLQWKSTKPELDGMFSYWPKRYALSQLVCNRDLLHKTYDRRLRVIDKGRGFLREMKHVGEPGITQAKLERLQKRAESGSNGYLHQMLRDFVTHLENERAELFKTKMPNIDIRHGSNFTGPKRGAKRRFSIDPWGTLRDIISCRK